MSKENPLTVQKLIIFKNKWDGHQIMVPTTNVAQLLEGFDPEQIPPRDYVVADVLSEDLLSNNLPFKFDLELADKNQNYQYPKEDIAKIRGFLEQHPKVHTVADNFHQFLAALAKAGKPIYSLQIELILREMKSPLYLIAQPIENFGDEYVARLPQLEDFDYPYCLGTTNPENAAFVFSLLGIDYAQNFVRLALAGLLKLRPDTEAARMANSHNN